MLHVGGSSQINGFAVSVMRVVLVKEPDGELGRCRFDISLPFEWTSSVFVAVVVGDGGAPNGVETERELTLG